MRKKTSLFERPIGHDDDCDWKGYKRVAGFDTMLDSEETWSNNFSFTLQIKSEHYSRSKHTRTFMCAVDATAARYVVKSCTCLCEVSGHLNGLWKTS